MSETDLEQQIRLTQAAGAITLAAVERPGNWQPVRVAAAQLTIGDRESKFAHYVWAGLCEQGPKDARCDPSPWSGKPRARSYWQLHRAACPAAWAAEHGSFAETRAAARCASRLFVGAFYRCKSGHAGAFAGYAGNCGWHPRRARSRANLTARLESRLRQLMAQSGSGAQQPVGWADIHLLPQQPWLALGQEPRPLVPSLLRVLARDTDAALPPLG